MKNKESVDLLPISVIITTYNDSEYLSEAIKSVILQSQKPHEIIVIDDGSDNERAYDVVSSFIENEFRISIVFFRKENGGASSARNYGLEKVSQEYVTFLDADDKMLESNLCSKFAILASLGKEYFSVYSGGLTSINGEYSFKNRDGVPVTDNVGKYMIGAPGGCCYYLFRRKCFDNVGYFDESLRNNEDIDLIVRFSRAGYKSKSIRKPGVYIKIRPNSLSRSYCYNEVFDGFMAFLDKAEKYQYFSNEELRSRRKSAYLTYGKAIIRLRPRESLKLFCHAFFFCRPVGLREYVVYIISKIFSSSSSTFKQ